MATEELKDDASIADDAFLWRRIPKGWWIFDKNLERWRPTSQAFNDHRNGTPMSVVLAEIVEVQGRSAIDILQGHEGYALASFTARLARKLGQGIRRCPLPEEPAHAEVFGPKPDKVRSELAKESQWVIAPPEQSTP